MAAGDETIFLEQLKISQLLSSEEIQEASVSLSGGLSAAAVIQKLVDAGRLTPWQGKTLLAGQTSFVLGKYKLLSLLGQGGMGAVFKAEQIPLGRIVALKVMAEGLLKDQAAVARFHREIQAAAALEHPNVVTAFDADHVDQTTFLVMEYLKGESLNEVLERYGRLPPATACEYIRQAALGLQHAHERGMAHRDIKPSNLLLTQTEDGAPLVKILDMGLARFTSGDCDSGELTKTGQVMGTPDYIAPEQAMRTKDADIRSDIYSLGCTLFRMLTGVVPFSGDNVMEKLMARAMNEAPLVRKLCPDLSAELESVVARMLAREPSLRYQTPLEVARALEKFGSTPFTKVIEVARHGHGRQPVGINVRLNPNPHDLSEQALELEIAETIDHVEPVNGGETILMGAGTDVPRHASPAALRLKQRRQAERRKLAVGVPLAAVALVAIVFAWLWHSWGATSLVLDWPERERSKAQLKIDGLDFRVPEKGVIHVPKGRQGRRKVHLARDGFKNIDLELEFARGETKTVRPEWVPTAKTVRGLLLAEFRAEVDAWQKKAGGAALSDAERKHWTARYQSLRAEFLGTTDLTALETLWRKLPSLADQLSTTEIPSEAREGFEKLTDSGDFPAELVSIWGDGRMRAPDLKVHAFAVQPQGQLAVTFSWSRSTVWDLQTGRPWTSPLEYADACTFSQDGEYFALGHRDIQVWSVKNRQIESTVPNPMPTGSVRGLAFIPGTRWLAIAASSPDVFVWDLERNALQTRLPVPDETQLVIGVAASHDGQWLAAAGVNGVLQLWNLKTGMSRTLARDETYAKCLAFRPDGQVLASGAGGPIHLWDVATGNLRRTIPRGSNYGVHSMSWNAAGTLLAANAGAAHIALWNPEDGTFVQTASSRGRGNMHGCYTIDDRLVTCTVDGEIETWAGLDLKSSGKLPPKVQCAAVDPLGEWVATATLDREVQLRQIAGGEVIRQWKCQESPVGIAVRPDGQRLAVCFGEGAETTVQVIDTSSDEAPKTLACDTTVEEVAYSPDGVLLLGGGPLGITVWDAVSLERRVQITPPDFVRYGHTAMVISADSQQLFFARALRTGTHDFCLFSLPKGDLLYRGPAPGSDSATQLLDPNSVLVAVNSGGLHVVDLAKRQFRPVELVNTEHLLWWISLAMRPQGGAVASGMDGKLRVVDQQARHVAREIDLGGSCNSARQVLCTPDGRHLVLVMTNGTVAIVRIPLD